MRRIVTDEMVNALYGKCKNNFLLDNTTRTFSVDSTLPNGYVIHISEKIDLGVSVGEVEHRVILRLKHCIKNYLESDVDSMFELAQDLVSFHIPSEVVLREAFEEHLQEIFGYAYKIIPKEALEGCIKELHQALSEGVLKGELVFTDNDGENKKILKDLMKLSLFDLM